MCDWNGIKPNLPDASETSGSRDDGNLACETAGPGLVLEMVADPLEPGQDDLVGLFLFLAHFGCHGRDAS